MWQLWGEVRGWEKYKQRSIWKKEKKPQKKKKNEDKQIKIILAFNFELQSVLLSFKVPFLCVWKLTIYNLTIFITWEIWVFNARCGIKLREEGSALEFHICVLKYIMAHAEIEHIKIMSDNCSDQQKKFPFSAMCLYKFNTKSLSPTLPFITNFFYCTR